MNKRNLVFAVSIFGIGIWVFIFVAFIDKPQLRKEMLHTNSTSIFPNIRNIWDHKCLNGGIYYPNQCRCPPSVTGKFCEIGSYDFFRCLFIPIDNCTPNVDWLPTAASSNGSDVICQFSPAIFHCTRKGISHRDLTKVNKLGGI